MPTQPRRLLAIDWRSDEFPTLPGVARKVLALQGTDDVSAADLEDIIGQDPALTMKIMKVVNSGYYNLSREITSIRHAIALLGIKPVTDLALGAIMARRFMTVPRQMEPYAKRLYRHCITTAILARDMEFELDEPDPYTLGLLHDIGWLPLMSQAPDVFMSMFGDNSLERDALEGAWGTDHQLWGAKLAEIWELPEAFMLAAYRHHNPLLETAPPMYLLLITIAHHLADSAGQSLFLSDVEPLAPEITDIAGIDQETFFQMETAAVNEKENIAALCSIMLS